MGKSAQTVHGDVVGAVFLQQLENRQIDAACFSHWFRFRLHDFGRVVRPSLAPLGRFVTIDLLVESCQFVEVDVPCFGAEKITLLTGRATAHDQEF